MSWTIHPRTIARQRRQQELLELLQTQPLGLATIRHLREEVGSDERTFSRDVTALEKAGHVQRYSVKRTGERRPLDCLKALWFPCRECNGYGEIDVVFAHGVQPQECFECSGTGRQAKQHLEASA